MSTDEKTKVECVLPKSTVRVKPRESFITKCPVCEVIHRFTILSEAQSFYCICNAIFHLKISEDGVILQADWYQVPNMEEVMITGEFKV
jgi:hypothetical protein